MSKFYAQGGYIRDQAFFKAIHFQQRSESAKKMGSCEYKLAGVADNFVLDLICPEGFYLELCKALKTKTPDMNFYSEVNRFFVNRREVLYLKGLVSLWPF